MVITMKRIYLWQDISGKQHILVAKSFYQARQVLLLQKKLFFKLTAKNYISKRSFSIQQLIVVTKQIATMLKAGLPIIETLTLIANDHPILQWQWLLNEIKQQLILGKTITQALSFYPDIFSPLYQEIIATGEITGQLENSFARLAELLEKNHQLQQKIKKALRYPIFLLLVTIIVCLIMLLVVLPNFIDVYQNFDAQLPPFTQAVITFSNFLQEKYLVLLSIIFISSVIYQKYLKKRYGQIILQLLLKLPVLGQLLISANLTLIFQTLLITQQSGIPLIASIATAQKTTYHQLFQYALAKINIAIKQGKSFSLAINEITIFPKICFQLIRVGEESGTLEIMLQRLANYYESHNDQLTDNLTSKIEPFMISIMALIIGSLVIAMYLPIFQLGSVIH